MPNLNRKQWNRQCFFALACALLLDVGTVVPLEGKLMDTATVLGACGRAFALQYIRASMQAGIEI
jgi:pyrroline-5-carboxylate reductase